MSYRWKETTAICEGCGEPFEKLAVSLSKYCDPCKKRIARNAMERNKREREEQ